MCCLTPILLSFLNNLSMIIETLAIIIATIIITLKLLNSFVFLKKNRGQTIYQEEWFGKDSPPASNAGVLAEDTSIRSFKIDVPEDVLTDLNYRLKNTRYEDPVENSKFWYGFNPNYLKEVVDYWRKEYDWRKHEKLLNQFPQFKTRIEGLDIHFMHIKPSIPEGSELRILPLLIVHGWPGSVVEFYKIIPLLTTPHPDRDYAFEVICPSIPGFGFSESPHRKGFTAKSTARIFVTLMERLRHKTYYLQGGDWGLGICQLIAIHYPSRILGMHVNAYICELRPWEAVKYMVISFLSFLISKESILAYHFKKILKLTYQESGYLHIQSTKPDTVGCSIADSPAGMAAYMLEKFTTSSHTDHLDLSNGGLLQKFTLDELLTNVMLYWVNNNFTASARFYKENFDYLLAGELSSGPVLVPSAIANFPNEAFKCPRFCMPLQIKNVVSSTVMPRGGHFAALEEPELLAEDIWKFISVVEKQ